MHRIVQLAMCLVLAASPLVATVVADDAHDKLNVELRDLLHDGEWAINRGRLKEAKQRLIEGDKKLSAQDPAYGSWRIHTLLARVALESEQLDTAQAIAADALKQLGALPQREEQQIRRDRQTVMLVLADIEAAWKDRESSLGRAAFAKQHAEAEAKLVLACLAIPNGLRLVDPAWELPVLRRLAELEQSLGQPREAADSWRQLVQRASAVRDRFAPRVVPGPDYIPAEPYLVAQRSLAAAYVAENRLTDAIACLIPLTKLSLEDAARVRILSDIAALYRQSSDYVRQREYLAQAVEIETRSKKSNPARLAQLNVEIAISWENEATPKPDGGQQAQRQQAKSAQSQSTLAQPYWTAAANFFEKARIAKQSDKDDPQRAKADEMLCLQQLQAIYQNQERYDDAERVAHELHDLRVDRLLPNDPRIFRSKSSWGLYLVKNLAKNPKNAATASKLLDDAAAYWHSRIPPEPNLQVRTWIARAEIHRAEGQIKPASELLDRAEAICAKYDGQLVTDKVRMSLCVNRGLIRAEQGLYQRAVESYKQALQLGDKLGPSAGELRASALVNLAMVYKSQLQFVEAREYCRLALEDRLHVYGPTDRDMLPYYIAAAGLDIAAAAQDILVAAPDVAQRNLESLGRSVLKGWEVCTTHHLERTVDPNVANVWHQRAMIDYIKNERTPNRVLRQTARDAFQQALALQEKLAAPEMQARTLHYLAKLKYQDWNEALSNWKNQDAKSDPEHAVHFAQFDAHRAELEKNSQEHVRLVEKYESDLATYKQALDKKSATPADFDTLERDHAKLMQDRVNLDARLKDLAREEEACQQKYLAAKQQQHGETIRRLDNDINESETLARQAVEMLDRSGVFPNLHYAALCNHGQILWSLAAWHRKDEPRRLQYQERAVAQLVRAVQLTETPRSMTTGGDIARAEFFSNYATAFDLLVDWYTQLKQPGEALRYAEMGRNRTFLDQIRASEFDVRDTLPAERKPLLQQEQKLLKQHSEKLTRARALSRKPGGEISPDEQRELQAMKADLETLQQQYALVRDAIYAANPLYSGLGRTDVGASGVLAALAEVSSPQHPLLYYYVGSANSHLFLVAGDANKVDHYALEIPQGPGAETLVSSRRVSAPLLRELVDRYREIISNEAKSTTLMRGTWKSADALVVTGRAKLSYTALTDLLLPPPAREKIHSLNPAYLTIVPDGPLHHLPFEALPLSDVANQKKFVFDDFPPVAYAPSVMILKALSRPRDPTAGAARIALTLGDPEIKRRTKPPANEVVQAVANMPINRRFVDSGADLPVLKYAEAESRNVQATFQKATGQDSVVCLLGADATEGRLRHEIESRRFSFIHLATHGFVDEDVFNLFGAIMLTPPHDGPADNPADDGQLRLYEIPSLKLAGCELAVLSACQTNIGPARPMETSSTFARAFLSAGVRRVISSQWSVEDESTSMLVKPFFETVVNSLDRPNAPLNYAQALHAARKGIRDNPKWSAPCYWAPFVLVGPAE